MKGVTTQLHCDGCTGGLSIWTTSWTLGTRSYKTPKTTAQMGWKTFKATTTKPRRDFCPQCVTAGRAK